MLDNSLLLEYNRREQRERQPEGWKVWDMYIRLGEIPEDEKSINWYKVSLADQRDFSWAFENYGYTAALREITNLEEAQEIGVSVFEATEEGEPIFRNKQQEDSFRSYTKEGRKAYIVAGDVVGYGADSEPLIKNIRIIEEVNLDNVTI